MTGYRKAALAVVISQLLGACFCGSSAIFAYIEIQYLEQLQNKLAKGKVSVRCNDLSLEQFELMLLLACEYTHVPD